jgi:hypothetical protein
VRVGLAFATLLAALAWADGDDLAPAGRLRHGPIREASGIVRGRRSPGIFWVLNDSGNPATLFAVTRDGTLVREFPVNMPNVDWEDLTLGPDGRLYIGDIGNNDGRLPLRAVYAVDEPDPAADPEGPLPVVKASYYRFPPGGRFDAEGLFIDRGRAVLVAKYLDGREADLFAVPLDPPAPLLRPALPERVGRLPGCTEPVTGAALAADRRRLAVCSYHVVRVYQRAGVGTDEWTPLAVVPFPDRGRMVEAVCWDGNDLLLAAESRDLLRIPEARWTHAAGR